jgi:uncharacterized protein (TIGR03437 family)
MTGKVRVHPVVLLLLLLLCAQIRLFAVTAAGWQSDLQSAVKFMESTHPDLFFQVSEQDFNTAVSNLNQDIPQLNDDQITVRFMELVAMVGDAHTNIFSPFLTLPIGLRWFSDGLYVTSAAEDYQRALGAKVIQIGSMTAAQAYAAVTPTISHESDQWVREVSAGYLATAEVLYALGITSALTPVPYVFQDLTGAQFELDIAPSSSAIVQAPDPTTGFTPLWTQNQSQYYWYQYLPSTNVLYIAYNQCENMYFGPSFASFVDQVAAFLQQQPVSGMIVDLRNNTGGNSAIIQPLLDLLSKQTSLQGHITVVIGRRTFSSGLMNAVNLADQFGAQLVGEPTGGKPNSYGDITELGLQNSGLLLSCSTRYFTNIPNDNNLTLTPDVSIAMSSSDYFARHDPFLLAALVQPAYYQAPQPIGASPSTVNAASFGSPVSPGALAAVFGDFPGVLATSATSLPLDTQLAGVQVAVNGVPAPLLGVWPTQINFQVPSATAAGNAQVAITVASQNVATGTVEAIGSNPGIFLADFFNIDRPGAVLTRNNQLTSTTVRSLPNDAIQIFATGAGPLTQTVADGSPAPVSPLAKTIATPMVFIGSEKAQVQFSGLAPDYVGVWQINAQIPNTAFLTGEVPLVVVTPDGYASNAVTIWVQ